MKCPKCANKNLVEVMGQGGVLVDTCSSCGGTWFDKGEVFFFTNKPRALFSKIKTAFGNTIPTELSCPRCRNQLEQSKVPDSDVIIDLCRRCEGLWLDKEEINHLNKILNKKIPAVAATQTQQSVQTFPKAAAGATLASLPNLAFRSGAVICSLYGLLVAFLFVSVEYFKLDPSFALIIGAVIILIQFVLGPFLMDLSLRWLYKFRWVQLADLPPHLAEFIHKVSREKGIPIPRCGIIDDGNPNAFTYGHTPRNARLVLTRGLIEILDEKELRGVVGHEMGHILHWDMLVMTIAALVPIILYYIYRVCIRSGHSRSSNGKGNPLPIIGIIALVLYYVTQYFVLFISRTRELYADRFAGKITGAPNTLASALVKIAYGLAGQRKNKNGDDDNIGDMDSVKTLGIFDPSSAKSLVASSISDGGGTNKENILGAMQWDMWNPWAKYYELHSTHPLPARRIQLLGQQAEVYGQDPFVRFDLKKPESYWDEFFVDFFVDWLPLLLGLSVGFSLGSYTAGIAAWGAGEFFKINFSYKSDFFSPSVVSSLLKKIKVSKVRGIPVTLKGKIIGRGIPGHIISEDMVVQDDTGFIFVDYRQPLFIFNWIFALRSLPKMIGQEVTLKGWYRRAPIPYIEIRTVTHRNQTRTCYTLDMKRILATVVLIGGIIAGISMGWV